MNPPDYATSDEFDYTPNPEAVEKVYLKVSGDLIYILIRTDYSTFDLLIYLQSTGKEAFRCSLKFWYDCPFYGHNIMLEFLDDLVFYREKISGTDRESLRNYVSMIMCYHPSSQRMDWEPPLS